MAWGRLDDSSADHPKFERLNELLTPLEALAADGLWRRAWAYALKHDTDGFLPRALIVKLTPGIRPARAYRLADALVAAKKRTSHGESACGLWEEVEGGYQIHDFKFYNRTANGLAQISAKRSEAGRRGGVRSAEAKRQAKEEAKSQANAEALASSKTRQANNPVPSRPITPLPPEAIASPKRDPKTTVIQHGGDVLVNIEE